MSKTLILSVTKKDLVIETFRSGGKGGQNQNKRDTGVRIKHPASGAVGEARDQRTQGQNKRNAFLRMVNSDAFQKWLRLQTSRYAALESEVDVVLKDADLKVERKINGRWEPW